ncbi:thiolase family protein [candidate division KSB1 bacterium]
MAQKKEIFRVPKQIRSGSVGIMQDTKKKIVVLAATRTPFGDVGGGLKDMNPIDLGAHASRGAITQAGLDDMKELIDEAIFGNAMHTSIDSHYGARHVGLRAGLSNYAPGLTVNRICWSGGEAIQQACNQLVLGESDIVLAGGYESTSQSPFVIWAAAFGFQYMGNAPTNFLFKDGLFDTFTNLDMMGTAEKLGKLYGITREDADEFAYSSQMKAKEAIESGGLAKEITPVVIKGRRGDIVISEDEHPRPKTTLQALSMLHAVKPGGVQTGGNSSGIVDGAAALILTTAEKAKELGLKPIGEIISWAYAGVDPSYMGIGPVPACRMAMKKAGMTLKDIKNIEINEAFAAQYLAVEREMKLDRNKVNRNGGAIALGHPLGATGARLVTSLLKLGGIGMASACIGGGQGGAMIVEGYN